MKAATTANRVSVLIAFMMFSRCWVKFVRSPVGTKFQFVLFIVNLGKSYFFRRRCCLGVTFGT